MKTLKDKFVPDHLWYLVLAYMHDTDFKVIMKWAKYDKKTGLPEFHLEWLTFEEFSGLAQDAVRFYIGEAKDITEENIDKYAED